VLQHPRDAFATERVRDESGLSLELRGVAPMIAAARVTEVADRVGVTTLLDRPTRGLSAGEATLVAIAAAIVEHPILLLVDEPLADLDADARTRIARLLDALAHEAGMCVIVAEHRTATLAGIADAVLRIDDGAVVVADAADEQRSSPGRDTEAISVREPSAQPVLSARGITVRHRGTVAVSAADLDLFAGEIVALVGPNGAGKSSLLAALAMPDRRMRVESSGRVALVPDASDDLFVSDTVAAECRRADRRASRRAGRRDHEVLGPETSAQRGTTTATRRRPDTLDDATAARFAGFLALHPDGPEFTARLARHPRDLSVGERRCLALAIQLAGAPGVLLVDEPTRGLDPAARAMVWAALLTLAHAGTAVLVASHEPEIAGLADRVLEMRGSVLGAVDVRAPGAAGAARTVAGSIDLEQEPVALPAAIATPARVSTAISAAAPVDGQIHGPRGTPASPLEASGTPALGPTGRRARLARARFGRLPLIALLAANLVALGAFCWPLVATAVPEQAYAAVPIAALALAPLAILVVVATLDGTVRSAHMLALLGTLAAIGAAVRIAGTGVGGIEAVFILLILAGRAYGARFGMLLGMATIALSTVITGTFGPWTPFQMFACAWVGAVAGMLPRRLSPAAEIALLCVYGVIASYVFGLLMNLWFWPFAVGYGTGISYDGAAPLEVNLSSFLVYSLVTSTLSWDTLRAITTVIGLIVVGRPILAALRRAKPLAPHRQSASAPRERASALS
jgi:energy-coupling factor transport system ATP-binding protein